MLMHERDGWWLTLEGTRRKLDHEPEQDGDWLICRSNGVPIRVHRALAIHENWAWTWIIGSVMLAALMVYALVYILWGELTRR